MEVTLMQVLAAREDRVKRQRQWNERYGSALICFTMNIPGPVKDSPLIRRGFRAGLEGLDARLCRVLERQVIYAPTGPEALYAVALPAEQIKGVCTAMEEETALGRLFDMDVLDENLRKLDREAAGGGSRGCILCGAPGRGCASRRVHSVAQLQGAVRSILMAHFTPGDARQIGDLAVQALLDEVHTTPKPGLVDLRNTGSHRDMDVQLFRRSAAALAPYFRTCGQIGMETADLSPGETFSALRRAGLAAEETMLAATGGVNTHKGAIFTLGLLCGAAGRLWYSSWREEELFAQVAAMTAGPMEADFARFTGATAGQRLYRAEGIRGIRGEAALGLPAVSQAGLPAYREHLTRGMTQNDAGAWALLRLMLHTQDTCLLHRGGRQLVQEALARVRGVLEEKPCWEALEKLDDWFIRGNLSPGGSADLLAAVYFVDGLEKRHQEIFA